jgi:hypothetical protein
MGSTAAAPAAAGAASRAVTPKRRVRHEVRDSLAVMAFSALASCGFAALLTVMVRLGN